MGVEALGEADGEEGVAGGTVAGGREEPGGGEGRVEGRCVFGGNGRGLGGQQALEEARQAVGELGGEGRDLGEGDALDVDELPSLRDRLQVDALVVLHAVGLALEEESLELLAARRVAVVLLAEEDRLLAEV